MYLRLCFASVIVSWLTFTTLCFGLTSLMAQTLETLVRTPEAGHNNSRPPRCSSKRGAICMEHPKDQSLCLLVVRLLASNVIVFIPTLTSIELFQGQTLSPDLQYGSVSATGKFTAANDAPPWPHAPAFGCMCCKHRLDWTGAPCTLPQKGEKQDASQSSGTS